jgi:hypothetical protein
MSPPTCARDTVLVTLSAIALAMSLWMNARAFLSAVRGFTEPSLDAYSRCISILGVTIVNLIMVGYVEGDFPHSFISLSKLAYNSRMVIEDPTHYSPNATDSLEWYSLFPSGGGYVRLGPEQRPFWISMYHQVRLTMMVA